MKLKFTIHYHTAWGESLHVAFSQVVNVHSSPTYPMQTDGQGRWFITVEGDYKPAAPYTFVVMENGNIKRTEWRHHTLPDTLHGHVHISDRWMDRSELAPFYSSAFTRAIFAHDTHSATPHGAAGICICNYGQIGVVLQNRAGNGWRHRTEEDLPQNLRLRFSADAKENLFRL